MRFRPFVLVWGPMWLALDYSRTSALWLETLDALLAETA